MKKQTYRDSGDLNPINAMGERTYYSRLREDQKRSGEYVNKELERKAALDEIQALESEIGFDAGHGKTYDPHHPDTTPRYHMFRARNGAVSEISDPEEAQQLMDQGIVTPVL